MRALEFPLWILTLCFTLLYDRPFSIGYNIYTGLYALYDSLKYDPYLVMLIALTYATVFSSGSL